MYIARAFSHKTEFYEAIDRVPLSPLVLSVTSRLGTDWSGESAVFFQVVLDDSVPRGDLLALTKQVRLAIVLQVRPLEEWDVLPYFDFITQSEHAKMKEPAWV
ncbi:MAG: hypothetical protein U0Q16_37310 [Bryobacteraceae bacterium]